MKENKEHLEFARAALASQDRTLSALRDLQAQVEGLGEYVETVKAERDAARAEVERLKAERDALKTFLAEHGVHIRATTLPDGRDALLVEKTGFDAGAVFADAPGAILCALRMAAARPSEDRNTPAESDAS